MPFQNNSIYHWYSLFIFSHRQFTREALFFSRRASSAKASVNLNSINQIRLESNETVMEQCSCITSSAEYLPEKAISTTKANCTRSDRTKKKLNTLKQMSPSERLEKYVNKCVAAQDVTRSTQAILAALEGYIPRRIELLESHQELQETCKENLTEEQQLKEWENVSSKTFSWRALSSVLYVCERCHQELHALELVNKIRQKCPELTWNDESVLTVILRLQCAVNDANAATQLFHYLVQNRLLRLRAASTFLHFACARRDRQTAFGVYKVCLQHKIEIEESDYYVLGKLCVETSEPVNTLHFMLREMREHISSVSDKLAFNVIEIWWKQNDKLNIRSSSRVTVANHTHNLSEEPNIQYKLLESTNKESINTTIDCNNITYTDVNMELQKNNVSENVDNAKTYNNNNSDDSNVNSMKENEIGCCPACNTILQGYAFTAEHRSRLLDDLIHVVIPQKCKSSRALAGFEHWKRYINQRAEHDIVNLLIDGANVGYYGLSKWYADAKRALLLKKHGKCESQIINEEVDFTLQCKRSNNGVDVGVNFKLIDSAVKMAKSVYQLHRPLVVLHERHCEEQNIATEEDAEIIKQWRSNNELYCTPTGLNDDLCWLYAALTLTTLDNLHNAHTLAVNENIESCLESNVNAKNDLGTNTCSINNNEKHEENNNKFNASNRHVSNHDFTNKTISKLINATKSLHNKRCFDSADAISTVVDKQRVYVLTNDLMRDHHFKLLSPRSFVRWRDRHTINFSCVRKDDITTLRWKWPEPFTRCIQECSNERWHIPYNVLSEKESRDQTVEHNNDNVCYQAEYLHDAAKEERQQQQQHWLCLREGKEDEQSPLSLQLREELLLLKSYV